MNTWRIVVGDALERLRELEDGSVQTCITSPPYFGLRDYGTGSWDGGDEACDHVRPKTTYNDDFNARWGNAEGQKKQEAKNEAQFSGTCGKCGATRTDSQLGLEATPDEYVARLVEVFREVRRVLRDDGTLWLNLGDSYASGNRADYGPLNPDDKQATQAAVKSSPRPRDPDGIKPKDLLGIPWMVAFALRADGWYLRSDIIWAKPNPMPESVTDRPTKAHEYVFLLSKGPRYFFDSDAVREADSGQDHRRAVLDGQASLEPSNGLASPHQGIRTEEGRNGAGRNIRSVWTVATQPFPGAHFAVFPPKLIEPCVLAGSAEDACGVCGAPWERVVEQGDLQVHPEVWSAKGAGGTAPERNDVDSPTSTLKHYRPKIGESWQPSCDHQDKTGTSTVLDPFAGAGTTGLVATQLGRSFIGIELNSEYAEMARERIRDDAPLMNYLIEVS